MLKPILISSLLLASLCSYGDLICPLTIKCINDNPGQCDFTPPFQYVKGSPYRGKGTYTFIEAMGIDKITKGISTGIQCMYQFNNNGVWSFTITLRNALADPTGRPNFWMDMTPTTGKCQPMLHPEWCPFYCR